VAHRSSGGLKAGVNANRLQKWTRLQAQAAAVTADAEATPSAFVSVVTVSDTVSVRGDHDLVPELSTQPASRARCPHGCPMA
jgi:hypothetical protein